MHKLLKIILGLFVLFSITLFASAKKFPFCDVSEWEKLDNKIVSGTADSLVIHINDLIGCGDVSPECIGSACGYDALMVSKNGIKSYKISRIFFEDEEAQPFVPGNVICVWAYQYDINFPDYVAKVKNCDE